MIKIIHQTWKTKDVPFDTFPKEWIDSWLKFHPDWEYKLWTDEDNRNLVVEHYPQYLGLYDSYKSNIERADMVRYFILHKFGGLYVDLDCVAVQPLTEILESEELVLGVEPRSNWSWTDRLNEKSGWIWSNQGKLLSNAFMYSVPGHPYWEVLFEEASNPNFINRGAVSSTGPLLITRAYEKYGKPCRLVGDEGFPWNRIKNEKDIYKMDFIDGKIITKDTYVIHVNLITWDPNKKSDKFAERKLTVNNYVNYVYTFIQGRIPDVIKAILKHNEKICKLYGVPFKVLPFSVEPGECPAGKADWLRIEKASKEPRILYVDWDCEIESFPFFDPAVPMVGSNFTGEIDLWAYYNGDRTDLFELLYKSLVGKIGQFGSYYNFLNRKDFKKEFKIFPDFKHLNIGTGRATRKN